MKLLGGESLSSCLPVRWTQILRPLLFAALATVGWLLFGVGTASAAPTDAGSLLDSGTLTSSNLEPVGLSGTQALPLAPAPAPTPEATYTAPPVVQAVTAPIETVAAVVDSAEDLAALPEAVLPTTVAPQVVEPGELIAAVGELAGEVESVLTPVLDIVPTTEPTPLPEVPLPELPLPEVPLPELPLLTDGDSELTQASVVGATPRGDALDGDAAVSTLGSDGAATVLLPGLNGPARFGPSQTHSHTAAAGAPAEWPGEQPATAPFPQAEPRGLSPNGFPGGGPAAAGAADVPGQWSLAAAAPDERFGHNIWQLPAAPSFDPGSRPD
jgi:hypothetical protein